MSTAWALFRKDLRVYCPAVIGGAVVTVAPYLVLFVAVMIDPIGNGKLDAVLAAVNSGIGLAALISAALGGMSFAVERRDRTAEFLAMLPITRRRIAMSKLCVGFTCVAAMLAVHVAMLAIATRFLGAMGSYFAWDNFERQVLTSVGLVLFAFGVAWLASARLESAVISTCLAIGCAIVGSIVAMTALTEWSGRQYIGLNQWFVQGWYSLLTGGTGILAILVGRILYIRRVAP